ncbi:MAG: ribonuclease H-like domain-containing protein [Synergistaceae bacterium]|jgi:uncharacterized protein YprB with RNaseH-like and TPR domain|nr:ribonuclease H-like domain-containing protein [Synergistaceae bacterium]
MGRFDILFENDRTLSHEKPNRNVTDKVTGLPDGVWARGGVYRTVSEYKTREAYGARPLGNPDLMYVMRDFGAKNSVVFLDLETTGLSGGTGTYAFLCGLGRVEGDAFMVTQYFLKSPAYEAQWLSAIDADIPEGSTLVTYNGKTFDVPMLVTRHIMTRLRAHWESSPHIDLLHFSRKLYRGYLESCSLGNVERRVLGVRRSGEDVPGSMIPYLYMRYLRERDASPLRGVFYHNELDIASLAALYCHVARALDGDSASGPELIRAGDIWSASGRHDRASAIWDKAAAHPDTRAEACARRGYLAKKNKDYAAAFGHFTSALDEMSSRHGRNAPHDVFVAALEELAKIEEHRFASPERALGYVRTALDILKRDRYYRGHVDADASRAMRRRQARLERKILSGGNTEEMK